VQSGRFGALAINELGQVSAQYEQWCLLALKELEGGNREFMANGCPDCFRSAEAKVPFTSAFKSNDRTAKRFDEYE
jgi:hypothetical protein